MASHQTIVSIDGSRFLINGQPTYAGRTHNGVRIEGLLLNARMVQGAFDDENPATRRQWDYPDGPWDPDRNTREFIAAMPLWRAHGLLAFTINLQGGSPQGYSREQPWINSAFEWDGRLKRPHLRRMAAIIDRADELGMVVILGYLYFGQEPRMEGEPAVVKAVRNATNWVLRRGWTNVLIEIANECDVARYKHEVVKPGRVAELVRLVQKRSEGKVDNPARRLLVSVSLGGGGVPADPIVAASDFVLLHGNGVKDPNRIRQMVDEVRARPSYRDQPVLFNEDDHFDFAQPDNNMLAALSRYCGWGYFDYRMQGEGIDEGYQSVPVNWGISSARKRGFFQLLAAVTGSAGGR